MARSGSQCACSDVQETAINIGFACSLLRNDMRQYIIGANTAEVIALEEAGKQAGGIQPGS